VEKHNFWRARKYKIYCCWIFQRFIFHLDLLCLGNKQVDILHVNQVRFNRDCRVEELSHVICLFQRDQVSWHNILNQKTCGANRMFCTRVSVEESLVNHSWVVHSRLS
jgi:hypothetical protein